MKTFRVALAAAAAAAVVHGASGALADELTAIPGVKTKLVARANPIVCPFQSPSDQTLEFFGSIVPSQPAVPCGAASPAKVTERVVAANGTITANLSVAQGRAGNPSAVVARMAAAFPSRSFRR